MLSKTRVGSNNSVTVIVVGAVKYASPPRSTSVDASYKPTLSSERGKNGLAPGLVIRFEATGAIRSQRVNMVKPLRLIWNRSIGNQTNTHGIANNSHMVR